MASCGFSPIDQGTEMQTIHFEAETRTLLENVRWETYIELAGQRRGSVPRMTYFDGMLELTSPTQNPQVML